MKKIEVELVWGWKIAGKPAKKVVVGFFTAGDMLDAEEQPNDVARGLYLLARRIKGVGGREIDITLKMVRALSAPDLAHLQRAADELDEQVEVEMGSLGKPSPKQG